MLKTKYVPRESQGVIYPTLAFLLRWPSWLYFPVILVGTLNFVLLLFKAFNPLQLDYSEGLVISSIHRIMNQPTLEAAYSFKNAFYNSTDLAYPPVFPFLSAILAKLFSLIPAWSQPDSLLPVMYAMRSISLLSLTAIGGFIYLFCRLWGTSRLGSLTAAALFFCFHPLVYWGGIGRVDSLGLAFVFAGMYRLAQIELVPEKVRFGAIRSIPYFSVAFFTKQTLVAAPLAVIIYLYFSGRKREAARFTAITTIVYSGGLALLAIATGGQYFFIMTMERFTPFYLIDIVKNWGLLLYLYIPVLLIVAGQLPGLLKRGGVRRLLGIWVGLAFLISFTIGKEGSADYYFYEILALSAILVAHRLTRNKVETPAITWIKVGAILQLVTLIGVSFFFNTQLSRLDNLEPAYQQASALIDQYSSKTDRTFIELFGPAMADGRFDQVFDHFIFRHLVAVGMRDGQGLVQDVEQHQFKVMLMGFDPFKINEEASSWPPGFEEAIRQNYQLVEKLHTKDSSDYAWILIPR